MKKVVLTLVSMITALGLAASERTAEQAAEIAVQFVNAGRTSLVGAAPARQIGAESLTLAYRADKAFYIFNESQGGYIVVSADDRAEDVLLYASGGSFDIERANPDLRWWLARYERQLAHLDAVDQAEQAAFKSARDAVRTTTIAPLLVNQNGAEITWYQETPYNNLCPIDKLDNTRSYTGCVATAMAQIMYKWRWPRSGTGTHSYTWKDCKNEDCNKYWASTLSFDFENTTFDWDNMLPTYQNVSSTAAQKNAVATLMYACGVACEMMYGGDEIGGSGSFTDWMAQGLEQYLGYTYEHFISNVKKSYYESEVTEEPCRAHDVVWELEYDDFAPYFDADLEAGRPILMGGAGAEYGHEFVCDGRDTSGKYHINWGWEGDKNCYVSLSAVKASRRDDFSDEIEALVGIQPHIPSAIDEVEQAPDEVPAAHKLLRDGQLLILRGNNTYNIQGTIIQ